MSKFVKVMIALVLTLAVASPALADFKWNGYYRLQMVTQDITDASSDDSNQMIDNRLRFKFTNTVNDNISVVYYGEVDTPWGESSKGAIGGGGKVGADGVNIETKNAYVKFKIPSTSFTLTTGIQGIGTGNAFEDLVYSNDMTAAKLSGDVGPAKLTLVYAKWDEGARSNWDDTDMYAVTATFGINENVKLTGHVTYQDLNASGGATDLYAGVNADVRFGKMGVEGFFLYRMLDGDDVIADGDAFVVDGKFRTILPMGDLKVHAAYFSEDDDDTDNNRFAASSGAWEYHNDNLMIFLQDIYYNNSGGGSRALYDAAYAGYGLWFVTVSGKLSLPSDMYAKYGAGYFSAVDEDPDGAADRGDADLGFEVAAMIGKKFAEKYDVSLRGAYAAVGDFYGDDTEDFFKVVGMVNVSY